MGAPVSIEDAPRPLPLTTENTENTEKQECSACTSLGKRFGWRRRTDHAASAHISRYRSALPSNPIPGSSGSVTTLLSTFTPSGKPP
jgi:hypothetical protein